jgi:hypothetical protein
MARPGWYNDNRNRAFPFILNTVGVKTPDTGLPTMRQLPDDFIVDCGFVMGPDSGFDAGVHSIWLTKVYRQGNDVFFEFASDAPMLFEKNLTFRRLISEEDYAVEHVEGEPFFDESESASVSLPASCSEPLWSGYLISGIMANVAARLADGQEIVRQDGDAIVEPALIQNLNDTIVNSLEIANDDRTRATAPDNCPDLVWPHQTGVVFVNARCVQGDVRLKPGYNVVITQNDLANSITIGASVGAGEGQPCAEVPLFEGESPPLGATNNLLAGGPLCNETLRSFNGIGGANFTFLGGQGVSIVPDPENNCIKIDFNLIDMVLCVSDFSEVSESVSV